MEEEDPNEYRPLNQIRSLDTQYQAKRGQNLFSAENSLVQSSFLFGRETPSDDQMRSA